MIGRMQWWLVWPLLGWCVLVAASTAEVGGAVRWGGGR